MPSYDVGGVPRSQLRRRDRAVEDAAWIDEFLALGEIGVLATVNAGQPFINTNIYVYDKEGNRLYLHTARVGRTRHNLELHDAVCFSVSEIGRYLPAPTAKEFSVEYAGVVIFGVGRVVEDDDEKRRALAMLVEKYAPHLESGVDYRPADDEELRETGVYRIDIEELSAKRKEVENDFPGAYDYRSVAGVRPGFWRDAELEG